VSHAAFTPAANSWPTPSSRLRAAARTGVTSHRSLEMLKTYYSRDAEAFVGHAGVGLL
jgi:hypothetical protein